MSLIGYFDAGEIWWTVELLTSQVDGKIALGFRESLGSRHLQGWARRKDFFNRSSGAYNDHLRWEPLIRENYDLLTQLRDAELIVEHSAAISKCPALTMSGPSKTQVMTVAFLAAIAKLCH